MNIEIGVPAGYTYHLLGNHLFKSKYSDPINFRMDLWDKCSARLPFLSPWQEDEEKFVLTHLKSMLNAAWRHFTNQLQKLDAIKEKEYIEARQVVLYQPVIKVLDPEIFEPAARKVRFCDLKAKYENPVYSSPLEFEFDLELADSHSAKDMTLTDRSEYIAHLYYQLYIKKTGETFNFAKFKDLKKKNPCKEVLINFITDHKYYVDPEILRKQIRFWVQNVYKQVLGVLNPTDEEFQGTLRALDDNFKEAYILNVPFEQTVNASGENKMIKYLKKLALDDIYMINGIVLRRTKDVSHISILKSVLHFYGLECYRNHSLALCQNRLNTIDTWAKPGQIDHFIIYDHFKEFKTEVIQSKILNFSHMYFLVDGVVFSSKYKRLGHDELNDFVSFQDHFNVKILRDEGLIFELSNGYIRLRGYNRWFKLKSNITMTSALLQIKNSYDMTRVEYQYVKERLVKKGFLALRSQELTWYTL